MGEGVSWKYIELAQPLAHAIFRGTMQEYPIGQFSLITKLSVKTLRFYHEKGILVPARVDPFTCYRYYNDANAERARIIVTLRHLEFSIEEGTHDC
jgi:hypothetical protein